MAVSRRRLAASRRVVFDRLLDAEHYPDWLIGARHVAVRDPRWPRPDSSFDHEVGVGPVTVHDSTTVDDIEPGRSLELEVRARPFLRASVTFVLEDSGTGTLVTMTEKPLGPFALLSPVIAPLVRVRNDRSLARLARIVADR